MRNVLLILLTASAAWAQVEERCGGRLLATFTPGDTWLLVSDSSVRTPVRIDVIAEASGPLVHLSDVAFSKAGALAVAGVWSATNAGFVLLDANGHPKGTVDTWPFVPSRLVFGPDGIVWAYGGVRPELRSYSVSGEHIGTATLPAASPDAPTYLGASNSRIGVWFRESSRWLEFAPDGRLTAEIDLAPPPVLDSRVILTDANDIFGGSAQALYMFNRRENRWIASEDVLTHPFPGRLLGADGPRLILGTDDRGLVFLPH